MLLPELELDPEVVLWPPEDEEVRPPASPLVLPLDCDVLLPAFGVEEGLLLLDWDVRWLLLSDVDVGRSLLSDVEGDRLLLSDVEVDRSLLSDDDVD